VNEQLLQDAAPITCTGAVPRVFRWTVQHRPQSCQCPDAFVVNIDLDFFGAHHAVYAASSCYRFFGQNTNNSPSSSKRTSSKSRMGKRTTANRPTDSDGFGNCGKAQTRGDKQNMVSFTGPVFRRHGGTLDQRQQIALARLRADITAARSERAQTLSNLVQKSRCRFLLHRLDCPRRLNVFVTSSFVGLFADHTSGNFGTRKTLLTVRPPSFANRSPMFHHPHAPPGCPGDIHGETAEVSATQADHRVVQLARFPLRNMSRVPSRHLLRISRPPAFLRGFNGR